MELKYPWLIMAGIPLLIFVIIVKVKREKKYKTGTKIANTQYTKKIPYYQKILAQYKLLTTAMKIVCIICICISLLLAARPVKIETSETQMHSRDIFICIDASTSVNDVTIELSKSLKEILDELNGERVGITIFNTTSVLLAPLTDDYEYIAQILDNINRAISEQEKQQNREEYSFYWEGYMFEGTITGNEKRGSSLIGDGLASCIYNFPNIDEDRSRSIIFVTDNLDNSSPRWSNYDIKRSNEFSKRKRYKCFFNSSRSGSN